MTMTLYGHRLIEVVLHILPVDKEESNAADSDVWIFEYYEQSYQIKLEGKKLHIYKSDSIPPWQVTTNDRAICRYPHRHLLEIKRYLTAFLRYADRYTALTITEQHIELHLKYSHTERTLKESAQHKRVPSHLDLNDLKYGLLFYNDGYVMDAHQGQVSVSNRNRFDLQGFGYSFDQKLSERKALLEYLERCAASCELEGTLVGSYQELEKKAIHPSLFGLYLHSTPTLSTYSDELEMSWVKAKSLFTNQDYYLPEQLSQYMREDLLNRYVYESSNGCAIGQSLVEATLYALLEAIERDLFMKCWFYDQPLRRISFHGEERPYLKGASLYLKQLGYRLELYAMDNDMHLPAVWCLITSSDERNSFYSITGLGCHLHIDHAMDAAFFEAIRSFEEFRKQPPHELRIILKEVEHSQEIKEVIDHMHYFLSYQSKQLIEACVNGRPTVSYEELVLESYQQLDLDQELENLLSRARSVYSDILMINQTNSLLRSFSLSCTKVLLLGAIPLDFTSKYIRSMPGGSITDAKLKRRNIHPLA